MSNTAPEQWFVRRIRRGLAALIALRLDGHPPADVVDATAQVWCAALWPHCRWDADKDDARIAEAFRQLALHSERWPSIAAFLRVLPPRVEPTYPSLPPPQLSDEELAAHRAYIQQILESFGHGIN